MGNLAQRVEREATLKIPSDHIAKTLGFNRWTEQIYLVLMEYIEGSNLESQIESKVINNEQKKEIFRQLLQAVWDMHRVNAILTFT